MKDDILKHLGSQQIFDPELFKKLTEKQFNLKVFDKSISYRTVNYWDEKGYLLFERDKDETEWRKLSFVDYIWLRMLDELRKMGIAVEPVVGVLFREFGIREDEIEELSLDQYASLKQMPFDEIVKKVDKEMISERFCLLLVNIIAYRVKLAIRIFNDGEFAQLYSNPDFHGIVVKSFQKERQVKTENDNYQSFISISIANLISEYVESKDLDNIVSLSLLTDAEAELMNHVRNKELHEITISFAEGKPTRLKLTEVDYNADIAKRICEDMMGREYVECNYTTNTKKQVTFKRTTKVNL
jgi:DNA-binding transcriptional MerR regulator